MSDIIKYIVFDNQKIKIPPCKKMTVTLIGGGGGGGGAVYDLNKTYSAGGGGGGSSQISSYVATNIYTHHEASVQIGRGGLGGNGGSTNAQNGSNGSPTILLIDDGTKLIANQGYGGKASTSNKFGGTGGNGYSAAGGGGGGYTMGGIGGFVIDQNVFAEAGLPYSDAYNAMDGGNGYNNSGSAGHGSSVNVNGSTAYYVGGGGGGGGSGGGTGGSCGHMATNGINAGTGGGGGAGFSRDSVTGANGGNGANGLAIVTLILLKHQHSKHSKCCNSSKKIHFEKYQDAEINQQFNIEPTIQQNIEPSLQQNFVSNITNAEPLYEISYEAPGSNIITEDFIVTAQRVGATSLTLELRAGGGGGGNVACGDGIIHGIPGAGGGGSGFTNTITYSNIANYFTTFKFDLTIGAGGLATKAGNPSTFQVLYGTTPPIIPIALSGTSNPGSAGTSVYHSSDIGGGDGGDGEYGGAGGGGGFSYAFTPSLCTQNGNGGAGGNGSIPPNNGMPGEDSVACSGGNCFGGNGGNGGCDSNSGCSNYGKRDAPGEMPNYLDAAGGGGGGSSLSSFAASKGHACGGIGASACSTCPNPFDPQNKCLDFPIYQNGQLGTGAGGGCNLSTECPGHTGNTISGGSGGNGYAYIFLHN